MPEGPSLQIEDVPGENGSPRQLKLTGPVLLGNLFDFQTLIREDQSPALIIDMSAVPYIDSAGIGALVNAQVSRTRSERKLTLRGVNERVRCAMQVTKVESLFDLQPADDVAKAS